MLKYIGTLLSIALVFFAYAYFLDNDDQKHMSIFNRGVSANLGELGSKAQKDYKMRFPEDHRAHPSFDIEWWYLTSTLETEDGKAFWLQWTLFRYRQANSPSDELSNNREINNRFAPDQMFMSHASVHNMEMHWFSEKLARGSTGNAGQNNQPFHLFIDDWEWKNTAPSIPENSHLLPADLSFSAVSAKNESDVMVRLSLAQSGPFIKQGKDGFSIKSRDGKYASHYYSAPFIDVHGTIDVLDEDGSSKLHRVKGQAWFDQEWTSGLMDEGTAGWDWFSVHFDDGTKLMAFQMRLNKQNNFITASLISPDGSKINFEGNEVYLNVVKKKKVNDIYLPLAWTLSIPKQGIDISISTIKDEQYNTALVPYYEGLIETKGSHSGKGFMELTGYTKQ